MTYASGDPQFWPRPLQGRPGFVYSRPTWPNLPPGVPYVPTRYMDAAIYGVPVPPGIPPLLIAAANGLGSFGAVPTPACTARGGTCYARGTPGAMPLPSEVTALLCGEGAICVHPASAGAGTGQRPGYVAPPLLGTKRPPSYTPPPEVEAGRASSAGEEASSDVTRTATPGIRAFEGLPSWAPYALVLGGIAALGGIIYLIGKVGNKRRRPNRRRNGAGWREGVRVQYTPNAVDYYIDVSAAKGRPHPKPGDTGTVRAIPVGLGKATRLPGPGGGLVYVDWDTTGVQGVSPNALTRIKRSR